MFQQKQNLAQRFGASKMHLIKPPVASAAVHFTAVVLLLLIHCLLLLSLCVGVLGLVLVVHLVLQSSAGEERAGCFTLIIFLLSFVSKFSCLFLVVPWVGLQCVIVAFPPHTHFFFHMMHLIITSVLGKIFQINSLQLATIQP